MMLGKLQRAHPTLCGHFALAYLVGSNMLRAYLFFSYGLTSGITGASLRITVSRFTWKKTSMITKRRNFNN